VRVGVGVAQRPVTTGATQDARVDRRLRLVAGTVSGLAVLLCLGAVAVHVWAGSRGLELVAPYASDLVLGSLFPLAGAVVLWRQPRNAAGWVLLSCALVAVSAFSHQWARLDLAEPGLVPAAGVAVWLAAWTFAPYWAQPALLPLLFPEGRPPAGRPRRLAKAVLVVLAAMTLAAAFGPNDEISDLGRGNPLGVTAGPDPLLWVFPVVQMGGTLLLWLVATPVALVAMVRRQRRAEGQERAQLQWLMLGIVALLVLTIMSIALPAPVSGVVFGAGFACVPLALAVAVLRHGMLDVEVVVNRTIVYAGLTGVSVLAYVAVVAAAGRWMGTDGAAPLAAGLVVAVAAAARSRVQRWVDRRLFGARRDPYAVVQQVTASTAAADAPDAALVALVTSVGAALRLPFVQVLDAEGQPVAETGEPVVGTHVVPVVDRGREIGMLVVGRRSRKERLRPEELSALQNVAHRVGALLSARQLADDLKRSYAEVVRVREQERLRLRRDLHDGVGPSLAGVALQLEGLAQRLSTEPDLAARAGRARDLLVATVADVRRIVDGLRPAAVEELGLERALRELATREGDPVQVLVDVDLHEVLDPATEVAVYRIVGEAVTNALRHAGASIVRVRVATDGEGVQVEVVDDGTGIDVPAQRGVGLQSMHDRADELGGRMDVGRGPDGGTRVVVRLPVGAA
jgi:signal transduction histidine kinase